MSRWEQWREGWRQKDDWERFCCSWEFLGVAAMRAELAKR